MPLTPYHKSPGPIREKYKKETPWYSRILEDGGMGCPSIETHSPSLVFEDHLQELIDTKIAEKIEEEEAAHRAQIEHALNQ